MKGVSFMRGDGIRYAIEHAGPELAQAIWAELMAPKPSMDKIREAKARDLELKVIMAEKKHAESTIK